jgi:outer membrane protein
LHCIKKNEKLLTNLSETHKNFYSMQKSISFRVLITFSLLVLPFYLIQAQQGSFTLEQAIEQAWQNNLQLQQQRLSVDLAEQNLLQSRASLYPNLNASASHSYNFGRTVDPFTNDFATESVQSNNFNISSGVNLFSGFQVQNTIKQNRYELEAGKFDLERSYNDVALNVAAAYLQILFSLELVENAKNQLEITTLQVDRTNKLVEAGTLPRGSLLTIQAQQATEELQVVNAQNQLDLAYLSLSQIMFFTDEHDLSIVIPQIDIEPSEESSYSPLQVYNVAVQEQPQIKSADVRILSAERGLAVAKGGRSPSLSMRGSYGTGYSGASFEVIDMVMGDPTLIGLTGSGEEVFGPSFTPTTRVKPFSNQLNDNLNSSLGFFLSIPIFNNYQVKTGIGRSQIQLDNARLQSQIVREQLFQTIQQAHADATAALKRYTATEKNVTALQEAFRYTEQRFNVGMINTLEYNDTKNRLTAAESELLQSKYEYVFRMKVLDFYLGEPLNF